MLSQPRCLIFPLVICLGIGVEALGQPAPTLNSAPPIAIKQGQSIELTLNGSHLDSLASAAVADPRGVTVSLAKPEKPKADEIKVNIAAAADATLGEREMRLIGPAGVTRPLRVFVSQYPVVIANEAVRQPDGQELQLPATLVGHINSPGDIDRFRFSAAKGQTLIFDAHARRIGSPLEPVVTIHSTAGREMPTRVEHHGGDPLVIFQPPDDGQYLLHVRDLRYRGGGDFGFRVEAGQIPYLEGLLPSSGQPGKVFEARAVGYNLEWGERVTIDLSAVPPGRIEVRTRTPLGYSNPVPFEVTELPQMVESEPNDKPENANPITLPSEISGHMDRPADEDFFKLHLTYKQAVSLEVLAGRYGSPMAPLLQLRNVKGDIIESNDGTPDADARIARELEPGAYLVSVRDLTFAGGAGYWYRLKAEPAASVPEDFGVRFLPDSPRLHRGSNVAMWCRVLRRNGFKGDVTITPEGLPAGVSATPVAISEDASGWFTLAASPDAALGTVPIRLRASATIGTAPVSHLAEPQIDGRAVADAYLTVLPPAPFTVEAVASMPPQQIEQLNGEIRSLSEKLSAPDPKLDAALADWEKNVSTRPAWTVLNPATVASSKSTPLVREPDGSILAGGMIPAQDQYTITAQTDLTAITAVRLEVLSDDRLPAHGPGAAPNGNFVLTEFKLLASKNGENPQPVVFRRGTADFSQNDFPISAAIDNNPATGWAIDPQQGRGHVAVFETDKPVGFDQGTRLTFVLQHESPFPQHNIGRFRISVTSADPASLSNETQVPANVLSIVRAPAGQRTPEQRAELMAYYRSIDPQTTADRSRLDALRSFAAPYAQIERLENALKTRTSELDTEQENWEQTLAAGEGWSSVDIDAAKSTSGAKLEKESDGSIIAQGASPPSDVYELRATSPLRGITAVQLEALPDARLPGNGPGRAGDGNFILTRFRVAVAARAPATQPAAEPTDAPIESAKATFEQKDFGIAGALDEKNETGWGVAPRTAQPAEATFYFKQPLPSSQLGTALNFTLEHLSNQPQHTLGHFAIWATTSRQPDAAVRPPQNIQAILKVPVGGRSDEQKRELGAYFRSIAPSLGPLRRRLADLRATVPSMPLKFRKNRTSAIPVPITRAGNFTGDVQVTLEGLAGGADENKPSPIARELRLNPLTIGSDKLFGMLTFEVGEGAEPGTRLAVLKAEAKVGDDTIVQYSPAFPITIEK